MSDDRKQWVAVSLLVFKGDRLLAMQRAADCAAGARLWEVVSGRVRPSEAPIDAALREGVEESGVQFEVDRRPVDSYAAQRNGEPMTVIVYRARWLGGDVVLSAEHDNYRWSDVDEFEALGAPARLVEAARACAALGWS